MALKWLEERWKILLPTLASLGGEQEEQIKGICAAEIEAWRGRPSMRQEKSLRTPLTETRNRIRETFELTQDNCWCNPKSGQQEHLSLKYLNFSSQEWIDQTLPSSQELLARRMNPLPVVDPDGLLALVDGLFEKTSWQELVLAVGLATGRSVAEILKTGEFREKTAYSVWFAGPMSVYEVMCEPFEVPTLVRAERVLAAIASVRERFGRHFAGVERRDVSRQASPLVQDAAYSHFLSVIPLRPPSQNLMRHLLRGIYPRLAVYAYCSAGCDELIYMATIQNHRKILEVTSEEERVTLATAAGYLDYVLVDEAGSRVQRRGCWLGKPGVEVLSVFQPTEMEDGQEEPEEPASEEEELREALSWVIVDREGNIDRRQGMHLGEPGGTVLEVFREREGEQGRETWVTMKVREQSYWRVQRVQAMEEGEVSYDAAFCAWLDAYDEMYGSGVVDQVRRVVSDALGVLVLGKQDQDQLRRVQESSACPDLLTFVQRAMRAYSQTCLRDGEEENGSGKPGVGLEKGLGEGTERNVLFHVRAQTWERCALIKRERGLQSDDELFDVLEQAYAFGVEEDASELIHSVERLAGMAVSCLGLTAGQRSLIQEAMGYEGATWVFSYLQKCVLMSAEVVVDDCRPRDGEQEQSEE